MMMHIFGLRLGSFLIARGHTVIEAANGEKGVEVVESWPSLATIFITTRPTFSVEAACSKSRR